MSAIGKNADQAAAILAASTKTSAVAPTPTQAASVPNPTQTAAVPDRPDETKSIVTLLRHGLAQQLANQLKRTRTRAEINRDNARYSTGPKTEAGKSHSKFSAYKHGLCSQTMILPAEEQTKLADLGQRLRDDLRPQGEMENLLVQSIADSQFQIDRCRAIENNILNIQANDYVSEADSPEHQTYDYAVGMATTFEEDMKMLDLMSRYQARHHRQFLQTHERLRQVQIDRRKQEALDFQSSRQHRGQDFARYQQSVVTGQATPSNQQQATDSGFVRQTENQPPTTSPNPAAGDDDFVSDPIANLDFIKHSMETLRKIRKNRAA